jgi:K+-transporting ATPase ATPase C chain
MVNVYHSLLTSKLLLFTIHDSQMKNVFKQSLILTFLLLILLSVLYPLLISGIALLAEGEGDGKVLIKNGKMVGYELIGQKFIKDQYFWGRPSVVKYNAAASGGSNKGASNPEYLNLLKDRIDSFLVHNPDIKRNEIPAELITASGSGLDPDISISSAEVQIPRISKARHISNQDLKALVNKHIECPLWGIAGPLKINVLKLNLALDELSEKQK